MEPADIAKLSREDKHKITERIIVRYPLFNHIKSQLQHCQSFSKIAAEPECILITGVRGSGKTTLINSYAAEHPRRITSEGTVVPVLKARVPSPASTKSLVTELLRALGDPNPAQGSVHVQTLRLKSLIKSCEVELTMLDEFHQFIDRDSYLILYGAADWLKNLIDETKISFALWGLSYSSIILKANEQLERRFSMREAINPLKWRMRNGKQEGATFLNFLKYLDKGLPFVESSLLDSEEMAFRIYYATDGIVGFILKHNLIIFEIFKIDTPYNPDRLIKRNPLRNISLEIYVEFLVSVMNFLSVKEGRDLFTKPTSNKFWHSYSLKVISYFEDYPHNITDLFDELGREFLDNNYSDYYQSIGAIKSYIENKFLFFILVAFAEYENKTYNYPRFETIPNLKDDYIRADEVLDNINANAGLFSILHKKGLVILFNKGSFFLGKSMYIARKHLDDIREQIRTSVGINSVSELLHLTHGQTIRLLKTGLLQPSEETDLSNLAYFRFKVDDIENLIEKFDITVNQKIFEIKNGTVVHNTYENKLAVILDLIEEMDAQKFGKNIKLPKGGLSSLFSMSESELRDYLDERQRYLAQVEKDHLKRAAKYLEAKLKYENKFLTRRFNFDKSPFSNIDDPQVLVMTLKRILINTRTDYSQLT